MARALAHGAAGEPGSLGIGARGVAHQRNLRWRLDESHPRQRFMRRLQPRVAQCLLQRRPAARTRLGIDAEARAGEAELADRATEGLGLVRGHAVRGTLPGAARTARALEPVEGLLAAIGIHRAFRAMLEHREVPGLVYCGKAVVVAGGGHHHADGAPRIARQDGEHARLDLERAREDRGVEAGEVVDVDGVADQQPVEPEPGEHLGGTFTRERRPTDVGELLPRHAVRRGLARRNYRLRPRPRHDDGRARNPQGRDARQRAAAIDRH